MDLPVAHRDAFLWGFNQCGQLGLGAFSECEMIHGSTKLDFNNIPWSQISCGWTHTVALSAKGEVYTWGRNSYGQLGHGDNKFRNVPTKVETLAGETIVKVACGSFHTVVVTARGKVFTWGDESHGNLGHGHKFKTNNFPRKLEALDHEVVTDVICGGWSNIFFTSLGMKYFCGDNFVPRNVISTPTPRIDEGIRGMKVISTSIGNLCFACVTESGELHTWGSGRFGQLGHGVEVDQPIPKRVDALSGICCKQVSCGYGHTAVVTEDGKLYSFGSGRCGKLGHGDRDDKCLPTLVQAFEATDIQHVQCGVNSTIALTTSGYVYIFGNLDYEDKLAPDFLLPCIVEGMQDHNVVQISRYSTHCAVLVDPSPSRIRQDQISHFNNKEHSDVTFMVDNTPIYASIGVLSKKSQYFQAMFRSGMRESIEGVVVVPDVSVSIFMKMLEYLYFDNFVVDDLDASTREELGVLADMYLLNGLQLLCGVGSVEE